jgi:hypothetical protein
VPNVGDVFALGIQNVYRYAERSAPPQWRAGPCSVLDASTALGPAALVAGVAVEQNRIVPHRTGQRRWHSVGRVCAGRATGHAGLEEYFVHVSADGRLCRNPGLTGRSGRPRPGLAAPSRVDSYGSGRHGGSGTSSLVGMAGEQPPLDHE